MSASHLLLALAAALVAACQCKQLIFQNLFVKTVWAAALPNPGKSQINDGGWEMAPYSKTTVDVDDSWAGRFWARTGCDDNSNYETGSCGGLQCNGTGEPPVTVAELTFGGGSDLDVYGVSLVDGFNLMIRIKPTDGHLPGYRCAMALCGDAIDDPPKELQLNVGGYVVGCKSACLAFDTDQYCCRGAYGTNETCRPSEWPKNYAKYVFKYRCPEAYSYAYDEPEYSFTCEDTDYKIVFG